MSIFFKFTTIQPNQTNEYFRKILDIVLEEVESAKQKLIDDSPVGVSKQTGKPDLKSNWQTEVRISNGEIKAKIQNKVPASINRIDGRLAGKQPPVSALESWVKLKLKVPDKQVKGVAFVIARKIGKVGTIRSKRASRQFTLDGRPTTNGAIGTAYRRIPKRIKDVKL